MTVRQLLLDLAKSHHPLLNREADAALVIYSNRAGDVGLLRNCESEDAKLLAVEAASRLAELDSPIIKVPRF